MLWEAAKVVNSFQFDNEEDLNRGKGRISTGKEGREEEVS